MRANRGKRRASSFKVVSVDYRTELVRMYYQSDGNVSQHSQVAAHGRAAERERLDGAHGFYYIEREVLFILHPGSERPTEYPTQVIKNVGRTFYRWDCTIRTALQHAIEHPDDVALLMPFLVGDEHQLLVAFEIDDRYHYHPCEKRDLVLEKPKPQSRKEERTPANPKVNSAKVVSKLKN